MENRFIYDRRGDVVREMVVHETVGNTESFTTVMHENVDGILASVKHARENQNPKAHYRHAATIPMAVVERAILEGWFDDKVAWAKWLNDPDNAAFRVWDGRISGREGQ